jgi:hypothetical protein
MIQKGMCAKQRFIDKKINMDLYQIKMTIWMDKTETLAILGTPNTGDRQTKLKNSIE